LGRSLFRPQTAVKSIYRVELNTERPLAVRKQQVTAEGLYVSTPSSGGPRNTIFDGQGAHRCQALVILFLPLGEHPKSETANNKNLTPNLI
jgi:hypothetical protein